MPDAAESRRRAAVARMGFSGDAAEKPVGALSGGEKARLLMGLATLEAPHLLVLDEPTNHLDIDARAALSEALNDYGGAVVLITHDRFLLDACADRLWLVADGKVTAFDGDLDDYRRRVLSDRDGNSPGNARAKPPRDNKPPRDSNPRKGSAEPRPAAKPLRQRVDRAEAEVTRLTREIEKLDAALADGQMFARDPAKAAVIAKSRSENARALAKAEEDWLAAGAALEAATS
jgi:ATP-binding cassette subfamily F protein 3